MDHSSELKQKPIRINKILDKKLNHTKENNIKAKKLGVRQEIEDSLLDQLRDLMLHGLPYHSSDNSEISSQDENKFESALKTKFSFNFSLNLNLSSNLTLNESHSRIEFIDDSLPSESLSRAPDDYFIFEAEHSHENYPTQNFSFSSDEGISFEAGSCSLEDTESSDEFNYRIDWEAESDLMDKSANDPVESKELKEKKYDKSIQAHELDIDALTQKKLLAHAFERIRTGKNHKPQNDQVKFIEKRFISSFKNDSVEIPVQPDRGYTSKY